MVKTISSRSSSRVLEQVDDQGMREGKGIHTIRVPWYHKEKGAENWRWWGGVAAHTSNVRKITNFKNLHYLGSYLEWLCCILHPENKNGGVQCPWGFSCFLVVTCPRPPVFTRPKKYSPCLSLHNQGLLSWVTITYFTPPGGGEGGLMPLGLFLLLELYTFVKNSCLH